MSSAIKTTQQSSEPTAKKKFGKNLNKLTKPPAPPVSAGAKSSASSRNGLLLLSTKRPPTGANPASLEAGTTKGGILSNKSSSQAAAKPLPSLGLQYESNTSTHDALLGAVVGASRIEAQQQPDAWGVAEKHQKGSGDEAYSSQGNTPESGMTDHGDASSPNNHDGSNRYKEAEFTQSRIDRYGTEDSTYETQHAKVDDFSGRQRSISDSHDAMHGHDSRQQQQQESTGEDVQGQFMSRVAQERTEKRRMEEEVRTSSQKERSAQKLLELEQRMTSAGQVDGAANTATYNSSDAPSQNVGKVVLEKLNRSESISGGGGSVSRQSTSPAAENRGYSGRTLYDPNRTYSSLVGGGASKDENQNEERAVESEGASQNKGARAGANYAPTSEAANPIGESNQYSRQVIHLSSYEDRDRGERTTSAAPRMLFDPKSGSMVAVPVRDESGAGARRNKERGAKKGARTTCREKEAKSDTRQDNAANDGAKLARKGKGRKEENGAHRGRSGSDASSPLKVEVKKSRPTGNSPRKLPRTCGVLYTRDDKGSFYCADGCDGDLGYGAHSVPGGRNKNPDAYAKVVEEQKQLYLHDETPEYDDQNMESDYTVEPHAREPTGGVTLQTGFSLPEPKEQKLDWVKPNERIVLVTGVDDSPTLQATAKAFAPSQAALAAAAAAIEKEKSSGVAMSNLSDGSLDVLDDDDTDDEAPVSRDAAVDGSCGYASLVSPLLDFSSLDSALTPPSTWTLLCSPRLMSLAN
jgi:hypothetical protein